MINGKLLAEKLLRYARRFLHLKDTDEVYTRNLLLRELKLTAPYSGEEDISYIDGLDVPDTLVDELRSYAAENGLAAEGEENLFAAHILGLLTPVPSAVNEEFFCISGERGPQAACDYLYDMCVKNDYVQKTAIGRNLKWEYDDGENVLEITINLSKPEKDNKEIAKLLSKPTSGEKYPACALCKENEGFGGTLTHPARSNLRTVSVTLGGEPWFVQYSPYAYYNEHCIAISKKHTPMRVDGTTPVKLLDFVDIFPNYFIGSNAALPIVGGSILNHEHYQGGGHILPMRKAGVETPLYSKKYPNVHGGILNWYNSAARFSSESREELISAVTDIIEKWRGYTDETVGIYAFSGGNNHNTLSPIATKNGREYTIDVILRNNLTTDEYPDGVFHAHPEYFNIKKEGIGLIEAMGLFILPGRLKRQTAEIEKILSGERAFDEAELDSPDCDLYVHRDMIVKLKGENARLLSREEAAEKVRGYINEVCAKILECTAVFKRNEQGKKAFLKFFNAVGFEKKNA
ncbi:MAG: UDP-glucose--hexose-1-phosphate uridylyltransferase [Clostridia bacterium]|nr:UDP-glucose--hexose-1-phosphate uridylyltransferase [Clostridia bacterium]